jgi:signal transduction histidine kinase
MDNLLFVIYFIYGIAFLIMGLALSLEYGRIPTATTKNVFFPLAAFGLIHGGHEWFEAYLLFSKVGGHNIPEVFSWIRLFILISSFVCLFIFGLQIYKQPDLIRGKRPKLGLIILISSEIIIIVVPVSIFFYQNRILTPDLLDIFSRYALAFPGALLASLAFNFQAKLSIMIGKENIAKYMRIASLAFACYAISQLFVRSVDMFPASVLNMESFRGITGIPIQALRAGMAVVITASVYRITNQMEIERRMLLQDAQTQRLEALEKVQEETKKREELRLELLRHIVQAQEDERARIARELHDETAQMLVAISLDLAAMQKLISPNPDCVEINNRMQLHFKSMSKSIYQLVSDLRPAQLDELGIVSSLQYLADQFRRNFQLEVSLKIEGESRRLDGIIETVLFRVAQEALLNIVRHAQTKLA